MQKIQNVAQESQLCANNEKLKGMRRIAILASGSGTNAENIIRYFAESKMARVVLVLSNKADAGVLQRAEKLGIPSIVFSNAAFKEGTSILQKLAAYDTDFVVLAGFLLKIPPVLVDAYPNRMVNIHPALLPKYGGKGMYGRRVHEAVVAAGETESGITIHYVNEQYDAGGVIFQATCPVLPSDTAEDVEKKVHALEYDHFPQVIERVCKGG